jgi:hypothetical protein
MVATIPKGVYKNKAMIWTKQALEEICKAMPIPIKKLNSDNGSEFINANYYFAVICAEILQRG